LREPVQFLGMVTTEEKIGTHPYRQSAARANKKKHWGHSSTK